jgi:hypothetical protein
MQNYQRVLSDFLLSKDTLSVDSFKTLQVTEMASIFVDTAFIQEMFYSADADCSSVEYLKSFFLTLTEKSKEDLVLKCRRVEDHIIKLIKNRLYCDQRIFAAFCLIAIESHCHSEEKIQNIKDANHEIAYINFSRTFDQLDQIFNIDYQDEKNSLRQVSKERTYQGSGVNVQSSYATLLNILRNTKRETKITIVDLGAGYGRLGFVVGILYPQYFFIGYEIIQHRVDSANITALQFEISDRVQFTTQDLSALDFIIPDADIYYMYDPFIVETYHHVLEQLVKIGNRKKITIITKGNAGKMLIDQNLSSHWQGTKYFEFGNIAVFES